MRAVVDMCVDTALRVALQMRVVRGKVQVEH